MRTLPASPENTKKPFFKLDPLTTILLVIAIFIFSQVVAILLLGGYAGYKDWTEVQFLDWLEDSVAAQFMLMLLVAGLAVSSVFYTLKHAGIRKARIGYVKPVWRDILYAVLGYGFYFATYLIVLILVSSVLPSINVNQEQVIGFTQTKTSLHLWMAFVSLVILPPIWEETVFRGFLFSSLRAKFRLRYAILITSLIFGVVHLQFDNDAPLLWVAAIDTFVLSCYLCLLREKTKAIWAPMLLHAIKNMVAFYLLFLR